MTDAKKLVEIYDTTLRDGGQGKGISFSIEDKLRITTELDALGVHYVEGGWPNSNRTDKEYFERVRNLDLKNVKIAAFGSTCKKNTTCSKDATIQALVASEAEVVTMFGKSSALHAKHVLKIPLKDNLALIADSVRYLKKKGRFVIFDAEHFYDGFIENPKYSLEAVTAAAEAGADRIVLCDTNGGVIPSRIFDITAAVVMAVGMPVGIHAHNDSDLAVANSLAAVEAGATHVHGTINGFGERTGNANLCSVIPNLMLKMECECIPADRLKSLTDTAHVVSELANVPVQHNMPYIGSGAFAHKAGTHMDAMLKLPRAYEHIDPSAVGNKTNVIVSDQSGRANVISRARNLGIDISSDPDTVKNILAELKALEYLGYQFEGAEGSFELLVRKYTGAYHSCFNLLGFRVVIDKRKDSTVISEATVKVRVAGIEELTVGEGDGPVNALDNALRKALTSFYPGLSEMRLADFKVRVLDGRDGTGATVRVLITSRDKKHTWGTVGVSSNLIEASWKALVDSIEYKLIKDGAQPINGNGANRQGLK